MRIACAIFVQTNEKLHSSSMCVCRTLRFCAAGGRLCPALRARRSQWTVTIFGANRQVRFAAVPAHSVKRPKRARRSLTTALACAHRALTQAIDRNTLTWWYINIIGTRCTRRRDDKVCRNIVRPIPPSHAPRALRAVHAAAWPALAHCVAAASPAAALSVSCAQASSHDFHRHGFRRHDPHRFALLFLALLCLALSRLAFVTPLRCSSA